MIEGPAQGPRPRFIGSPCIGPRPPSTSAIVWLQNASWIQLRRLELDGEGRRVHGVLAGYRRPPVHHITLDSLHIHDNARSQQFNGISTKTTAWDWVIRNNRLERLGLGMYLGNSDGSAPFIRGTLQDNVIINPTGYGVQIKHQAERPRFAGLPKGQSTTTIVGNVIIKQARSSTGSLARPNLLVGHFPPRGPGANDRYLIWGNLLFENSSREEPLFQGEGHFEFFNNVLINRHGPGLLIKRHNLRPQRIAVFKNRIYSQSYALDIHGADPAYAQSVKNNLLLSPASPPAWREGRASPTARWPPQSAEAMSLQNSATVLSMLDLQSPRSAPELRAMVGLGFSASVPQSRPSQPRGCTCAGRLKRAADR